MLIASDPGEHAITGFIWFVFTLALAVGWLAVFVAAVQTTGAAAWTVIRRTLWWVVYVVPLPVGAYFLALVVGQEAIALHARFELSEAALQRSALERPAISHRAGLFQVTKIEDVESCVFLETGGTVLANGFAYCLDGRRPSRAMRDSPPDIRMSPMNGDWQKADWWEYEIVETSSY